MTKIMIADDDEYIRELVGTLLKNDGFTVCEAVNGEDALCKIESEKPMLCIIDIMMPKMDGFELCRQIRRSYGEMPLLILTAKAEISQKVKGFSLGTDDYLTKPFEPQELIARVNALLRRYKVVTAQSVQIGNIIIDQESHTVEIGGEKSDIPLKEFELLFVLAGRPGRTFLRDKLIEDIWGYDFDGNERTLDVHINRLRERFPAETSGFKITTIRGLGYRLEAVK
ncbi:response regulator transcription factor [Lacrimispora sp.]|uniref:response regulator transcription factor n=1 Tax=Lacrimispora sp. TaxID=2719234 RepID=UPI0028AF9911|nr:response regulator transcription factor [Lacrimispora sp.]